NARGGSTNKSLFKTRVETGEFYSSSWGFFALGRAPARVPPSLGLIALGNPLTARAIPFARERADSLPPARTGRERPRFLHSSTLRIVAARSPCAAFPEGG